MRNKQCLLILQSAGVFFVFRGQIPISKIGISGNLITQEIHNKNTTYIEHDCLNIKYIMTCFLLEGE